ncbi:MAG: O-antigen ligase family protein [Gammaproteobacteria bacterium]|nr:O-antigen ligase family protein [Gammaproteobacteria bacterium]
MTTDRTAERTSRTETYLAAGILFYAAIVFCLPVPHSDEVAALYPWWAKRVVLGKILLHELLFLAWIAFYGWRYLQRVLLNGGTPTRQAAIWLIVMAIWCGLISLTAPLLWIDAGRTVRLLLNAALMLAVVRWTRLHGDLPLGSLILGFFSGTVINLIISFQYPLIVNETLRLSGQNTPGVAMGLAIHFSAWLFYHTRQRLLQAFLLLATLVFAFSCALSYSRVGWFAGTMGLAAWAYLFVAARPFDQKQGRYLKQLRVVLVPIVLLALAVAPTSSLVQENYLWIGDLIRQKLSTGGDSDSLRWAYFEGSAEILSIHPLGVGYSGFFDAITATETYRSGTAAEEKSPSEANPHAAFLWYAIAGGIPGGLMAVLVFTMLLNSLRVGLKYAMGRTGLVLFTLVALPYFVIGLTVPYLFNSIILIVPAAIAAGWGWTQYVNTAEFTRLHTEPSKV